MSPGGPSGWLTSAKRTLVPPVSQTRTGKGKANSVMAGHKRKTPRRWSSGRTPFPGQNRLDSAGSFAIRRRPEMPNFYEFFCGGGMARAGLEPEWRGLFANDIDPRKGSAYAANWGNEQLRIADVGSLRAVDLPGRADLAWASFPCQDLSLAGAGAGLDGERSGTFWPFWRLMQALAKEER